MLPKMAGLLGYREREESKPKSAPKVPSTRPPEPEARKVDLGEDVEAEETPFWRLEICTKLDDEAPPDDDEAAQPVVWQSKPQKAPEPTHLTSWRLLLPRLRRVLALSVTTRVLDVDEVVNRIGRGEHLARLPLQRRRRWCAELQIISDRSRRMTPFREDQRYVSRHLKRLLPAHTVTFGYCLGGPWDLRLHPRSGPSMVYRPPAKGGTVLILGDLGCLAREPSRLKRAWQAFGQSLAGLDCRLIAR